jgi:sulfur carrier protein
MELVVNGESKTISDEPHSIESILKLFNVETPDMVSVQLNGNFVHQTNFSSTYPKTGDEIDFLYFMGGGQ